METGGLVIGRRVNLEGRLFLIAVQLTGPGQQAIRQPNSFAPDTAFAQQELERVRQEYAGRAITVDYIGEWHKHPTNYPAPSEGDVKQARTILQDPSYSLEWGEIVLPIATVGREGQLELKPYYFSRLHPKPVLIDLLVWEREGIEALLEETTSSSR